MRKMRKLMSLMLAVAMILAMSITSFAADTTLTINAASGHTYNVYQLLKGDVSDLSNGSGKLANVEKGENLNIEDTDAFITAISGKSDQELSDTAFSYVTGDAKYTITSSTAQTVESGYYVVEDTTTDGTVISRYMVAVAGDTTMSPKTSKTPELVKKVQDTNDTDGTTAWQDSADYDIGDSVPFKLTATLPDGYADYHTYYLSFNDTLSEGLTLQASTIKVSVDGTELKSGYYIYGTQNSFKVVIYDLKTAAEAAKAGSSVTVEYSATLNDKAKLGSTGNSNTANLTYSTNPNTTAEGTAKPGDKDEEGTPEKPSGDTPDGPGNTNEPTTPDDKGTTTDDVNIVFTYKVVVNKVDEEKNALVGASFKLEKKLADGTTKDLGTIDGKELSTFEWDGIDDGTYVLTETVTPAGYNSIKPITFTVTAEHDVLSDSPALTSLDGGDLGTGEVSTGKIETSIENTSGTLLPSTGGIGTTIFYVLGAILVLGAGVVLIARRRVSR